MRMYCNLETPTVLRLSHSEMRGELLTLDLYVDLAIGNRVAEAPEWKGREFPKLP